MWRLAAALLPALLAVPGAAVAEGGWPPRLDLAGGAVRLSPYGLLQLDAGTTFGEERPGGGATLRRFRLGAEAVIAEDWEASLIWEFGGTPGSRNRLYQASLAWSGLKPFTVTAGVFKPRLTLEETQDVADSLFLERPSIVSLVTGLAAGSRRTGVQLQAHGERWLAAASLTGPLTGPGQDSRQRGANLRLAGLPVASGDLRVHLGLSGTWLFRPPREGGEPELDLSDRPELVLDRSEPLLSTGGIRTDAARAGGVEAGLGWRGLWVQGEFYGIALDREGGGGSLGFVGGYVQAAWTLLGQPRRWKPSSAAWGAPTPAGHFNPAAGEWGALELGARFSAVSLNDGGVRGGRQRIWTTGLGWWPAEPLRLTLQYQYGEISGTEDSRVFHALALRMQAKF
jgi:phosphate-selective porin OprO/OprP